MKKNSKKWTIGISLVLVIVIAASLGIGSIIGLTKKPDDFINIYIGGEIYDGEITVGDDSVSDETKALMVQAQFMSAALFGTIDIDSVGEENSKNYELLLEEGNDWKTTIQLNDKYNEYNEYNKKETTPLSILNNFVEIKFLNDTKNKSVISYLDTLKETSTNPEEILFFMEVLKKAVDKNPDGDKIWLLEVDGITFMNIYGNITLEDIGISPPKNYESLDNLPLSEILFTILLNDYSYQVNVLTDMYTYSYLWQEPTEDMYDSIFTKELVYYKPSITFSLSYDAEKYEQSHTNYSLIEKVLQMSKSEVINSSDKELNWNILYKDLKDNDLLIDPSTYNDYIKFDDSNESFRGYQGITFGTSAGEYLDSNWTDIENTWHFNKENLGESITEYTTYIISDEKDNETDWKTYSHENIMTTANYYVPEGANPNNNGAVITDVPDGGEYDDTAGADATVGSIYLYSQLYPYTFKQVKAIADGTEAIMSYPTFSLFAKDVEKTDETKENIIEIEEANWSEGEIPDHYIFDDWFSYEHSLMGEIFISEAIINHDSSLTMNAQNYWKEKGFYINLSGSYETDLLTFIPNVLIKDNE